MDFSIIDSSTRACVLSLGLSILLLAVSCQSLEKKKPDSPSGNSEPTELDLDSNGDDQDAIPEANNLLDIDTLESTGPDSLTLLINRLENQGLVDVQSLSSSIQVDLKYASSDNFLGEDVYYGLKRCYLQPIVAEMLADAQSILSKLHPDLSLLIFDGVRPQSVQFRMWDLVKGTEQENYVAEPNRGSLHNFGAAVDLGLHHKDSGALDMGTPYDYFGDLAQPRYEAQYLKSGELSLAQVENRRLLRTVMNRAGFTGILNEWWHFNAFPKAEIRERFEIVR